MQNSFCHKHRAGHCHIHISAKFIDISCWFKTLKLTNDVVILSLRLALNGTKFWK